MDIISKVVDFSSSSSSSVCGLGLTEPPLEGVALTVSETNEVLN